MKDDIRTSVSVQGENLRIRVMRDHVPERDLLLPADVAEQLQVKIGEAITAMRSEAGK